MAAFRGSSRAETVPQITSWSYSRYKTYHQCPAKAKYSVIDRLKEPESPAMQEGMRVHKLAEDFLNGVIEAVPEELKLFADDYIALREHGRANPGVLLVEYAAAFRADLSPCGWFARDAWLRAKLDALVINDDGSAFVQDLKTGKQRQGDNEQLSLFALAVFLLHPAVDDVRTELWYAKDGALTGRSYTRTTFEALRAEWLTKSKPMLSDTEFLPLPGPLCKWCGFSKQNQGPCSF